MAIAKGIAKTVAIKKEASFGALPGTGDAQLLRHVQSTVNLTKDTYQAAEKRPDYQVSDFRHGTQRVGGNIEGELSLSTYSLLLGAALRKDWAAGATSGGSALTNVTAAAGPPGTFTRDAGSWITDGFRVGDVVRWTGWTTDGEDNNAKNFRITALSATVMTVAESVAAKAAGDEVTVAVPGSKVWVPGSGHTNDSFAIQHHFADIDTVELFLGCMVNQINLGLPPTGLATFTAAMLGQRMLDDPNGNGEAPYFVTPSAVTNTPIMAAVNGSLRLGGEDIAVVTNLEMQIVGNITGDPVIGSDFLPELFPGRVVVSGTLSAYYTDGDLTRDFINETELSLIAMLEAGGEAPRDFLNIILPRIKLGGGEKDDGEKGLVQTVPFQALLRSDESAWDQTTIAIQDSTLTV